MELLIGIILFIIVFVRISILNSKIQELTRKLESTKENTSVSPVSPISVASVATPTPIPVKPADIVSPSQKSPTENSSTEFKFGARVLTGVGIVAVLLGVGFFLRYAFENNIISEGGRVALGVIFGIILIGIGAYLHKKFSAYAQGLMGAGLGVLYISFYSAYSFYNLIDSGTAFGLLVAVAAIGIILSLKYDSEVLVGYSFVGAYIIPVLLPLSSNSHQTFIYLIILAITASVLSVKKSYSWLTVTSFIATFFIYAFWQVNAPGGVDANLALTYSTILFLIYVAANIQAFLSHTSKHINGKDLGLAILAPIFFYLNNSNIVTTHFESGTKLFVFFLACFYILLSLLVRTLWSQLPMAKRTSNILFVIAIPFLAIATALHFDGQWISVMWLVEAAVVIGLGTQTKTSVMRYFGLALYGLSIMRSFIFDFGLPLHADFIFNTRMLLVVVIILVSAGLWYVYKMVLPSKITPEENEKDEIVQSNMSIADEVSFGKGIGLSVAYGSFIIWLVCEFVQFNHTAYITVVFALIALVGVALSSAIKENIPRYMAYAVLAITYGDMFFRYILNILGDEIPSPITNMRVVSTITILIVSALVVHLAGKESPEEKKTLSPLLFSFSNALFFVVLSQEVLFYFNVNTQSLGLTRTSLSLAWLVYAVVMLGVGILKQYAPARIVAIILFAITILKVFLYDTANLSDIYRFISFISLGIILLLVGFVYYRFKDRIIEFMQAK